MPAAVLPNARPKIDGKFFRIGRSKFYVKGVTYGPFAPNDQGEHFASRTQTAQDFARMKELGANLLRTYYVPPRWFLDLAQEFELKVLVDIPWNKHLCFLDREESRAEARSAVVNAARACASHPAVFALSLVNEIPPDIVRWSGAKRMAEFIDELVGLVKAEDPECLCTFGNYPTTEFLRPKEVDFICFNVYIHQAKPFENYLARLQMIADSKPLILGEIGIDSRSESEDRQSEILAWKLESAYRGGLAGAIVYSFTDDWYKDGRHILDWAFGLTDRDRQPKPAFRVVRELFRAAPYFPLREQPMVSVVVACYNGARTLDACLDSLKRLNYPAYEVILVDDGSTDATPEIVARHPNVRCVRHQINQGLSVARNSGIEAAQGEIVAFTDSDCRADADWLYYLIGDLLNGSYAGIGGHNLLPPEDSWVAAAVMVSPGGPTHVMLTDRLAEHIPGCNMAFYRWALLEVGCFDPLFRKAGDDVDICWRLQQRGYQLGFSPAGFVWHYRRSTVVEYLKQQKGYGEAEALLVRRHPEYFNWFGGSQWQGRIYSPAKFGVITRAPMVYHGVFGSAYFQTLYTAQPSFTLMLLTNLEYHVLMTLPLAVLSAVFPPLLPVAVACFVISLLVCGVAAVQAEVGPSKRRFWSRPMIAFLFLCQPIVRGWARYQGRLGLHRTHLTEYETLDSLSLRGRGLRFKEVSYWNEQNIGRIQLLAAALAKLERTNWPSKADAGWNRFDLEIYGSRWCHMQLITAAEILGDGRQLIRCRLKTAWTLLSRMTFWCLTGVELLILGCFELPWLWLVLLTLPAFVWWLAKEQEDLRRLVSVFLDKTAEEVGLTRATPEPSRTADPRTVAKPLRPILPIKKTDGASP